MRIVVALLLLAGASALSFWIQRRQTYRGDAGGAGEPSASGRVLATRGRETVAAMVAFILVLLAILLVGRAILRF